MTGSTTPTGSASAAAQGLSPNSAAYDALTLFPRVKTGHDIPTDIEKLIAARLTGRDLGQFACVNRITHTVITRDLGRTIHMKGTNMAEIFAKFQVTASADASALPSLLSCDKTQVHVTIDNQETAQSLLESLQANRSFAPKITALTAAGCDKETLDAILGITICLRTLSVDRVLLLPGIALPFLKEFEYNNPDTGGDYNLPESLDIWHHIRRVETLKVTNVHNEPHQAGGEGLQIPIVFPNLKTVELNRCGHKVTEFFKFHNNVAKNHIPLLDNYAVNGCQIVRTHRGDDGVIISREIRSIDQDRRITLTTYTPNVHGTLTEVSHKVVE